MKRLILMLGLVVLLIPILSSAQLPNPTGIAGSFTSTGSIENEYIISLSRLNTSNKVYPAEFIYKFFVSDTCRIVLSHSSNDGKFKPDHQAASSISDDYTVTYIPLESGIEYSIDCHATDLKIYRAGTSVTLTYSGVVEYE